MKTFIEFIQEQYKSTSWLSWPSAHSEIRKSRAIKEDLEHLTNAKTVMDKIHKHEDVAPQALTKEHKSSIKGYTGNHAYGFHTGHQSSENINGYLRNKAGDKKAKIAIAEKHEEVHAAVKQLSSAFTKENTNKVPITTYGGVPHHVAKKITEAGAGSHHHLAGFTSSSSKHRVAQEFASEYDAGDDDREHETAHHVIAYHLQPHAGLSVAHHADSEHKAENEVILHHGAHIQYTHSDAPTEGAYGDKYHVHHVNVFPDHKPLEHYGSYDHPAKDKDK